MTCYSAINFGDWRNDSRSRNSDYIETIVFPMLDKSALFGGVDQATLSSLFRRCYLKVMRPNETVYRAGDLPDAVYLLVSGSVRLSVESAVSSIVKENLCPGATFGDTALLGIQPHSDTAVCLETSEILAISSQALADLHSHNPALFTLLLLNMARDISRRLIAHDHLYGEFSAGLTP